ncbi:MAG: A/G-specific adenine glycosylase [Rhizobacter sp.]|nr:A/G-specific adenine glycosylase [Rhizobacter sp.]
MTAARPRKAPAPDFAASVIQWQRTHGRHALPWQGTRDPYRVWLSEIMLQQTQVTTVKAYYARFLHAFPNVAALAAAELDQVLALWSGLGYYSRARHLHRCAQTIVAEHGGRFPDNSTALAGLPGIGRSTAAAIAAFCFGERAAILDGNVKRVLTRAFGFSADLAEAANERELWVLAEHVLPERGIEAYTQGLMDLGATLCTARAPQCAACPLQGRCVARRTASQQDYPVKSRRLRRGRREHVWLWLQWRDQFWLVQRPPRGVWAGLWSLPEYESSTAFDAASATWPGAAERLPTLVHTLTHFDWTLHPVRWTLSARTGAARVQALVSAWPEGRWFTRGQLGALGLPAPVRRLLQD